MKLCEICGENPATVPDRERLGRPINHLCTRCHGLRLRGDLQQIIELRNKKLNKPFDNDY